MGEGTDDHREAQEVIEEDKARVKRAATTLSGVATDLDQQTLRRQGKDNPQRRAARNEHESEQAAHEADHS
ncbi:hypothetical protein ACTD5D_19950 [Nocardia takedensis]|uniref:hypothetical protein n=1 Tax=Nocardia takedensis TaxID=259390 RepID=UPI000593A215|nr:hypothetical protein [Nocardia takedensis]